MVTTTLEQILVLSHFIPAAKTTLNLFNPLT
jgi:hypothetical protein